MTSTRPLSLEEYQRYARQLIMPEVGLQGQLALKNASVLIVGLGGLGCPAAQYLAGAGLGTLGLVDGDIVELSNLHRQLLHSTETVGWLKVDSAAARLRAVNPLVRYVTYETHLSPRDALATIRPYDLVLDCTDHPTSRYLISDACVLARKPLVSASALRTDGQLTVLNYPPLPAGTPGGGPCYRCIWPKPPPAESVMSCGEGGILGTVVGVMGVLMAGEALKLITSGGPARSPPVTPARANGAEEAEASPPSMLLHSSYSSRPFQSVRLPPGRRKDCPACSASASITVESLESGSLDYVAFCGVVAPVDVLRPDERVGAGEWVAWRGLHVRESEGGRANRINGVGVKRSEDGGEGRDGEGKSSESEDEVEDDTLVDVREKVQFELASVQGSINVPFSEVLSWKRADDVPTELRKLLSDAEDVKMEANATANVHGKVESKQTGTAQEHSTDSRRRKKFTFICRLGNDSQVAVQKMKELGFGGGGSSARGDIDGGLTDGIHPDVSRGSVGRRKILLRDIQGGFKAWRQEVDPSWPDF